MIVAQKLFEVTSADQPAPSRLHRAELPGGQQVLDQFPGDAQQFRGLFRAVRSRAAVHGVAAASLADRDGAVEADERA